MPNYPTVKFYSKFFKEQNKNIGKPKLIYQGTVSEGHGLEQICFLIKNMNCELQVVGRIDYEYKTKLTQLCDNENLIFHGQISYNNLPFITSNCNIGLAINVANNVIYKTGDTASNKIYEYAACGLPILYFDNEHYRKYLDKYEWAFATDLSEE